MNVQSINRIHDRNGLNFIAQDMDSWVCPTHGNQGGTALNGHHYCNCCHPNFLFNQFGMLERCALRHGNVHGTDGCQTHSCEGERRVIVNIGWDPWPNSR
jgi:hypothetical protein